MQLINKHILITVALFVSLGAFVFGYSKLDVLFASLPTGASAEALARVPREVKIVDIGGESTRPGAVPVDPAEEAERVLPVITGRDLRLNVSAAIPAVLLDVGFPAEALRGVPILARTAGLIGHLTEELAHPIGFALSYQATREQQYTGTLPAGVTLKSHG